MNELEFKEKAGLLFREHEALITRKNAKVPSGNGVFDRYQHPVVTAEHAPVSGATIWIGRPTLS